MVPGRQFNHSGSTISDRHKPPSIYNDLKGPKAGDRLARSRKNQFTHDFASLDRGLFFPISEVCAQAHETVKGLAIVDLSPPFPRSPIVPRSTVSTGGPNDEDLSLNLNSFTWLVSHFGSLPAIGRRRAGFFGGFGAAFFGRQDLPETALVTSAYNSSARLRTACLSFSDSSARRTFALITIGYSFFGFLRRLRYCANLWSAIGMWTSYQSSFPTFVPPTKTTTFRFGSKANRMRQGFPLCWIPCCERISVGAWCR